MKRSNLEEFWDTINKRDRDGGSVTSRLPVNGGPVPQIWDPIWAWVINIYRAGSAEEKACRMSLLISL